MCVAVCVELDSTRRDWLPRPQLTAETVPLAATHLHRGWEGRAGCCAGRDTTPLLLQPLPLLPVCHVQRAATPSLQGRQHVRIPVLLDSTPLLWRPPPQAPVRPAHREATPRRPGWLLRALCFARPAPMLQPWLPSPLAPACLALPAATPQHLDGRHPAPPYAHLDSTPLPWLPPHQPSVQPVQRGASRRPSDWRQRARCCVLPGSSPPLLPLRRLLSVFLVQQGATLLG